MDDGDIDENFEYFCDHVLPTLDIDQDDWKLVDAAFEDWMNDEDFYLM